MSASVGPAVRKVGTALRVHGSQINGGDSGPWMAQCPAHEDRTASLSLAQGDTGAVLNCHAGCDTRDVLVALGLGWAELFDKPRGGPKRKAPRRAATEYKYTDEQGEILFVKVRFEPKSFAIKRPDGRGGWIPDIGNAPRVMYRLPELLAAIREGVTVYLVEGEKDADRLASMGVAATCNFDGAAKEGQRTKWRSEYGDVLRDADVVIIADRDAAGLAHARAAAADLSGKAKSVAIRQAAVNRPKADVSDHLDAGLTLDQLEPVEADSADRSADAQEPLPELPRFPVESLTGPLKAFVEWCARDGLHPEAAVAAGLAALVTLTGPSALKIGARRVRAILWIAIVGAPSSGKSPPLDHAFARIREHYQTKRAKYEQELSAWQDARRADPKTAGAPPAVPEPYELDDVTIEAVARWLIARQAASGSASGAVIDDELDAMLESLNQYKGGQGSDKAKLLKAWTGAPIHIKRVGRGGAVNEIDLYVAEPVFSIAGALTPDNVHLLGSQGSGFRPRWLMFRLPDREPDWLRAGRHPEEWTGCIDGLIAAGSQRERVLSGEALRTWDAARKRWNAQQGDAEPDDVIEALRKADTQCLRVALVIAESLSPGDGGDVTAAAMVCAVAITDYCIDAWRYLQGVNALPSSRAEDVMDRLYRRFLAWLETRPKRSDGLPPGSTPRPCATRADCQRWSRLKRDKFAALIAEHAARFPGSVVTLGAREGQGRGQAGGIPTVLVYAPERVRGDGRSVFAQIPKTPMHTSSSEDKAAGRGNAHRYSHTQTPNDANTDARTANPAPGPTPPSDTFPGWPADDDHGEWAS